MFDLGFMKRKVQFQNSKLRKRWIIPPFELKRNITKLWLIAGE